MKDFNPMEFLQMLKKHISECVDQVIDIDNPCEKNKPEEESELPSKVNYTTVKDREELIVSEVNEPLLSFDDSGEDLIINLQSESKKGQRRKEKETGGYRLFSSKSKKKKTLQEPVQEEHIHITGENIKIVEELETVPVTGQQAGIIDVTQNTSILQGRTGLRYIGNIQLPPVIQVQIKEGEVYSIGRFDATVGKKQSSFEFDKRTKAVSRRHAVVERDVHGYNIIDLASSAGTFVNDKKLPPNTPFELESGYRVSFGNSGADYVWEVS